MNKRIKDGLSVPTDSRKALAKANFVEARKVLVEAQRRVDRALFLARRHGLTDDEITAVELAVK